MNDAPADDLPAFTLGRAIFPAAWSKAVTDGLISEDEYVDELLRHTRKENERLMPGVPWTDLYPFL